jgi:hypothetical protein
VLAYAAWGINIDTVDIPIMIVAAVSNITK